MSDQIVEIAEADLPQNLKVLWLKALSAVEMQNHTYAISLVNAVLKEQPGFLLGRQLARKCAVKIQAAEGKKKKSGGMTALLSGGVSSLKLSNVSKKDPASALILIEKELEKDPYDPNVNEVLFDTAMRLNLLDTAAFALETVRKGVPDNTKLMHKLAEHYLLRDMPDLATDIYNDIVKQDPTDIHAVKGAKDSSARASMKKQKWEDAQSIDDLKKDKAEISELEASDRAAMTKDQQLEKLNNLIRQYQNNQNDLKIVKEIAQLYEGMEDWKNAHAFFQWAYQISDNDAALKLKAGQIGDKVANEAIKEIESQLEADPDNEELRQKVVLAKQERAKDAVIEAEKRVEQNPTDPQLRFELGTAFYNAGQYSEAIPHLQQATRNPHIRTRVLLTLARAFDGKGMHDLAIKQLSDALSDLPVMDTIKKEVLYAKGLIHEKMGSKGDALDCYKQIYEVDYSYLDVAKRVESSYT